MTLPCETKNPIRKKESHIQNLETNYDMEMEIDICMLNEYHEGAISASVCFCIADATTVGFILFYGNKYS